MKLGKIYGGIVAACGIVASIFRTLLSIQYSVPPVFLALAGFSVYYLADIAENLGKMDEEDDNQ